MDANGVDLVVIGLEEFGAEEFVELNFFEGGGMFYSGGFTCLCLSQCIIKIKIVLVLITVTRSNKLSLLSIAWGKLPYQYTHTHTRTYAPTHTPHTILLSPTVFISHRCFC